jgi:hypothetical protein
VAEACATALVEAMDQAVTKPGAKS